MFKDKMTFDEMAEEYIKSQSIFLPNRVRVGKFAQQMGYASMRQNINKKQIYFYVKKKIQ